jgi:hypothetical protein
MQRISARMTCGTTLRDNIMQGIRARMMHRESAHYASAKCIGSEPRERKTQPFRPVSPNPKPGKLAKRDFRDPHRTPRQSATPYPKTNNNFRDNPARETRTLRVDIMQEFRARMMCGTTLRDEIMQRIRARMTRNESVQCARTERDEPTIRASAAPDDSASCARTSCKNSARG